jgi:hypothetical protein
VFNIFNHSQKCSRALQNCKLETVSNKRTNRAKSLFHTSANHQQPSVTHVFQTAAENKFCVLKSGRLLEFELPLQLSEPTFLFDLSFSKISLYDAMCQNTEAFREHFAKVLSKYSKPEKASENTAFYRKLMPFFSKMTKIFAKGSKNQCPQLSIDLNHVLDEELWRCFQEDLTPERMLTSWLDEVHTSLILLLGIRLISQAKKQVLRTIKTVWQKFLVRTLRNFPHRIISMANILLDLAKIDQDRKLLKLIPSLYGELVKEMLKDSTEATEQLVYNLENCKRVLKKVYSKDILEQAFLSVKEHDSIIVPKESKFPESCKTQNTWFLRGLREYYLGRLNKAIFYWTKDIKGK